MEKRDDETNEIRQTAFVLTGVDLNWLMMSVLTAVLMSAKSALSESAHHAGEVPANPLFAFTTFDTIL